ncbi:MAG: hypothetical protein ACLP9C_05295 [Acidimicrobiales bacterium]
MATTRYRCTACGNLTRFDVTTTRTTKTFNHYTVGGELEVEEEEVLAESVDEVSCRWCGHGNAVEVLAADAGLDDGAGSGGSSGQVSTVR